MPGVFCVRKTTGIYIYCLEKQFQWLDQISTILICSFFLLVKFFLGGGEVGTPPTKIPESAPVHCLLKPMRFMVSLSEVMSDEISFSQKGGGGGAMKNIKASYFCL